MSLSTTKIPMCTLVIGKKARQFDIGEMMAMAKRRTPSVPEEKDNAKQKGKLLQVCLMIELTH